MIKFHEFGTQNVASRAYTRLSAIWPGDLVFDPIWPIFKLIRDYVKAKFWSSFISIVQKMWPAEHTQGKMLMTDDTWWTPYDHKSSLWALCARVSSKLCGKGRKCWQPAFSPFLTILSKGSILRGVKSVVPNHEMTCRLQCINNKHYSSYTARAWPSHTGDHSLIKYTSEPQFILKAAQRNHWNIPWQLSNQTCYKLRIYGRRDLLMLIRFPEQ